jgi:hypothetical protein
VLKVAMGMKGEEVRSLNGRDCFVRPRTGASGATTRSQATNEARTPRAGRPSGGTPDGEHAEGGGWQWQYA